MTKRVGVFGGAGFIGRHVVNRLAASGYDSIVFDGREPDALPPGASFIATDLLDAKRRSDSLNQAGRLDAAVWLAASIKYETSLTSQTDQDLAIMVAAPLAVVEQIGSGLASFTYLSSVEAYGRPVRLPIDEDHPLNPAFPYGATKLCAEYFLRIACDKLHLPLACLRLAYVYGPGQHANNVIPRFVSAVRQGSAPVVFGAGADQRDDVFVGDVAAAVASAIDRKFNGALNIASGEPHSLKEVAEAVCRAGGGKLTPRFEDKPGAWIDRWFDISRAGAALGYTATPFARGIATFWPEATRE